MNTLIKILIGIAIVLFFASIAKIGIARQEKVECKKLEYQAENYPNFYYTKDQAIMCNVGVD